MSTQFNPTFSIPVSEWKSQWRIDLERRRKEVTYERSIVRHVAPARIVCLTPKPKPIAKGFHFCKRCFVRVYASNKHQLCPVHARAAKIEEKRGPAPICAKCGDAMRRDATVLICAKHGRAEYKRLWWIKKRRKY